MSTATSPVAPHEDPEIEAVCNLLRMGGYPVRLRVLMKLKDGDRMTFELDQCNLAHHLRKLRRARLIVSDVVGAGATCKHSITPKGRKLLDAIEALIQDLAR